MLLGLAIAAYLGLSLLDNPARADVGPADHLGVTDPVASVKEVAGGAKRTATEPKTVKPKSVKPKSVKPKSVKPTVRPQRAHRPGDTVRQARDRAPKLPRPTSTTAKSALTAVERRKAPAADRLPELPEPTRLPDRPQVELRALPLLSLLPPAAGLSEPPDLLPLPGLPHVQLSAMQQLPGTPQGPMPALTQPASSASALLMAPPPQPVGFGPGPGPFEVLKPPAPARTAPLPASPQPPVDRSTSTGQARDAGGGNASAMGTVSSSWRPEAAAAGHRPAIDLLARGRTARYAGPPS